MLTAYLVLISVVLVVVLSFMLRALSQIHVLVNSRLTEALEDIASLKKALSREQRRSEGSGKATK